MASSWSKRFSRLLIPGSVAVGIIAVLVAILAPAVLAARRAARAADTV
ncbi:MAG: hypothetical protein ACYC61_09480 [Isosphaeraceae bacterium]